MTSKGFLLPPLTMNDRADTRHVGFELEFAGIGIDASAEIIVRLFGGRKEPQNRFHCKITGTRFGEFSVESDASLLKNRKYQDYLRAIGLNLDTLNLSTKLEDFIAAATSDLVPYEIVTPPIPLGALESVEHLRQALHEAGAQGTRSRLLAAFGFQMNPELPALDTRTLLAYMRSFFLLYDHLRESKDIPIARRVLPYIDPFPDTYIKQVLDPEYNPDRRRFMTDYLSENPTRNRPLDWLPLFAYLDRSRVDGFDVEHELIKPRPTLHYRLPSCLIDDPTWTIAHEWNQWVEIETLASDPLRIEEMSREYLEMHGPLSLRSESRWRERSEQWIQAGAGES